MGSPRDTGQLWNANTSGSDWVWIQGIWGSVLNGSAKKILSQIWVQTSDTC